jgi:hypothetical protein
MNTKNDVLIMSAEALLGFGAVLNIPNTLIPLDRPDGISGSVAQPGIKNALKR